MQFKVSFQGRSIALTFDGKPSADIRSALKANSFRWSPSGGYWWRANAGQYADFTAHLRVMLDREAGIRRPDGVCWDCKEAQGFIREYAATAVVRCDACQEKYLKSPEYAARGGSQYIDVDRMYEDDCARACGL
jgi:hypothetical protein